MHGTDARQFNKTQEQGFTLIELLVVLAITAVLFGLLLVPLVQAVRLTQRAQILAAAQDSARKTLEQVAREAGSAVYVFDNASHPFTYTTAPAANADKFTNFLNLQVVNQDKTTYSIAHAYNAKLDLVPARRAGEGNAPTDPTTGGNDPIDFKTGVGGGTALGSTGALFPLAPGSTIVRYFVGLKQPAKPYANSNERLVVGNANDNTYVLYRAQVPVYDPAATTSTVDSRYFTTKPDGKPELDDPDFFRYVNDTDVDWLSAGHVNYDAAGAQTVDDHNRRVAAWVKIAKPVITAPAIDLLIVPHNADGTVLFDTVAPFAGVPHQGATTDPVSGTAYPTVKTSVTFAPATLTADAAPSSTTAYGEEGVPTDAADNDGLPYVPTVYTASNSSWGYPYNLTLFQYAEVSSGTGGYTTTSVPRFRTDLGSTTRSGVSYTDMIEYLYIDGVTPDVPVYDVTAGIPIVPTSTAYQHRYVPLIVNPDTGSINFAVPALPDPNDKFQRFWTATPADLNTGDLLASQGASGSAVGTPGVIDLTNLVSSTAGVLTLRTATGTNTSPLTANGATPAAAQVANAHLVPGSVRVYGPDATPGPNLGSSVLYSPVGPGMPLSFNQYKVDNQNGTLAFFVTATESLPTVKADNTTAADLVKIAFDYQANLSPTRATLLEVAAPPPVASTAVSAANPARPLQVKVDYQTRDLMDINIGVRVYDPTDGHALTVPQSTRVQIGNPNR